MAFSFIERINSLNDQAKERYYLFLLHELTIVTRAIWSDDQLSSAVQVDQIKWVNEIMHRILNRLLDLQFGLGRWTEEGMWETIKVNVAQHPAIGGLIGGAIEHSYQRVCRAEATNTGSATAEQGGEGS